MTTRTPLLALARPVARVPALRSAAVPTLPFLAAAPPGPPAASAPAPAGPSSHMRPRWSACTRASPAAANSVPEVLPLGLHLLLGGQRDSPAAAKSSQKVLALWLVRGGGRLPGGAGVAKVVQKPFFLPLRVDARGVPGPIRAGRRLHPRRSDEGVRGGLAPVCSVVETALEPVWMVVETVCVSTRACVLEVRRCDLAKR